MSFVFDSAFRGCDRRETMNRSRLQPKDERMSATEIYSPGLEGVIAGESAIATVEGGLRYRGYPVTELAEFATFEEVAYLLLYGELPNAAELRQFRDRVTAAQALPPALTDLLKALP